jgi:hypothetical protein
MKNPIDDIFGIEREEEIEQEKPPIVLQKVEETDDQAIQDFEMARQNIIDTIEESKEVVAEMINVAKLSQHPRAYEVLGTLLKMQIDSNKDLLELRRTRNELMGKQEEKPSTINNNLIMSSADVLKLISESKKK